jgi:hypothetical protein
MCDALTKQVKLMVAGKLSIAAAVLALAGCGLTDTKDNLANFDFQELPDQVIEAAMDATGAGRQILFVGQTPVPHRCHDLRADLSTSSNTITVTITVRVTNAQCSAGVSGFRYTGNVEMSRAGTYQFTVRHVFPAGTQPMTTFTKEVVVQ